MKDAFQLCNAVYFFHHPGVGCQFEFAEQLNRPTAELALEFKDAEVIAAFIEDAGCAGVG